MAIKNTAAIPDDILNTYGEIIDGLNGIERKRAAMPYTSLNGHMFSFLAADGTLSLRLPKESREAFISKYRTRLSEQHGTILKEYVLVPNKLFKDVILMKQYFKEIYDYIKSLKPKQSSTKTRIGTQKQNPR